MMKACKTPNLNSSRFRQKCTTLINNELLAKVKEKSFLAVDLSYKDIEIVIRTFNKKIWEEGIENRDGIELLYGLGKIFVGTCKAAKTKNINIPKSIKYGMIITHQNWDTDGNLAKIFYVNSGNKYKFKHNEVWRFIPNREFKRTLATKYKEDWNKYIKVEPTKLISQQIKNQYKKEYLEKRKQINLLEEYNEFDMS